MRDMKVYYHVGLSGCGKSYSYVKLLEQNPDDVYLVSDYTNGFLDGYNGENILFLDEFRGQMPFTLLLCFLQGYKQQFHARYRNVTGLWTEVHITSVIPPERLYNKMVSEHKEYDTYEQLRRRLDVVVYHYKDKNDNFKFYECPMNEYNNFDALVSRATGKALSEQFMEITKEQEEYIQMVFGV